VEFTARQYSHIYKSRFENKNSIIEKEEGVDVITYKTSIWGKNVNSCCEWGKYQ